MWSLPLLMLKFPHLLQIYLTLLHQSEQINVLGLCVCVCACMRVYMCCKCVYVYMGQLCASVSFCFYVRMSVRIGTYNVCI